MSRSGGQNRRMTLPMMFASGTEPNVRESDEKRRLSPRTKISPGGTVNGYVIRGACGCVSPWASPGKSTSFPFTNTLPFRRRSEEHTSELQSLTNLVCRLLLEKKND